MTSQPSESPRQPRVEYIGDGVYAMFDGFAITIWTERSDGRHYIMLEPEVLFSLNTFALRFINNVAPAEGER